MATDLSTEASWYLAMPLRERLHSLRQAVSGRGFDPRLAEERVAWWRAQHSLVSEEVFNTRLALEGLSAMEFGQLLAEPAEAVMERAGGPPAWLELIRECFAVPRANPREAPPGLGGTAMWAVIAPMVSRLLEQFEKDVARLGREHAVLPFDPATVGEIVLRSIPTERLWEMLGRTLVLELNVVRLRGQLAGDTPEARLEDFRRRLGQREVVLDLLREYPVLARQIADCLQSWVQSSLEILEHLCQDYRFLRMHFSPEHDLGPLTRIDAGRGDSHRRGRSVAILEFASGLELVYKPRSLAVDVHFQDVLRWINARSETGFRMLTILDRSDHGWAEFIAHTQCSGNEEVRRFYYRMGGLIALLCALDAGDMHSENLIASADQPVVVDLECLFQPRLYAFYDMEGRRVADENDLVSVLRSDLLPRRMWSNEAHVGVDVTGMGARDGDEHPDFNLELRGRGGDECHFERRQKTISSGGQNRPRIDGKEVRVEEFADETCAGFADVYRLLARHRDEFYAAGGPVLAFANDEIRVLSRDTRTYSLVLEDSYHPDYLRDALDRDRLLDHFWNEVEIEERRSYSRLIPYERIDLIAGDIPLFRSRPTSLVVLTSGGERLTGIYERPGMEMVLLQAQQIEERQVEKHLYAIRTSLATLEMNARTPLPSVRHSARRPTSPNEPRTLLDGARAAARRLASISYSQGDAVCWLGPLHRDGAWSLSVLENTLADGHAGIALFLAYLADLSGNPDDVVLARKAAWTVRFGACKAAARMLESLPLGWLDGWGGVIHTLAQLGSLTGEDCYVREARGLVVKNLPRVEHDRLFSLSDGTAGLLAGVLALERVAPSKETARAAQVCGEHLLRCAEREGGTAVWPRAARASEPMTGFAHGSAGIALVLSELARQFPDERFRHLAIEALSAERTAHVDGSLRYGAAGIGLALASSLEGAGGGLAAAVAAVRGASYGDFSLGHGKIGALLCLDAAVRAEAPVITAEEVRNRSLQVSADLAAEGWVCGVPLGVETPGFMEGIAGIGYGLLRLAAPARVPPLVGFEVPARHALASARAVAMTEGDSLREARAPLFAPGELLPGRRQLGLPAAAESRSLTPGDAPSATRRASGAEGCGGPRLPSTLSGSWSADELDRK